MTGVSFNPLAALISVLVVLSISPAFGAPYLEENGGQPPTLPESRDLSGIFSPESVQQIKDVSDGGFDSFFGPVQDLIGPLFRWNEGGLNLPGQEGCTFQFQYYNEGDQIHTNEPCLNCTCHKSMLMCYLKVCPFKKPIGSKCTVEKTQEQCCPIITCPKVPVQVMEVNATYPAIEGELGVTTRRPVPPKVNETGLVPFIQHGCTIDKVFYMDGMMVPADPTEPCEKCYCIRNHTACIQQNCVMNIPGCKPSFQDGKCCPIKYLCDEETPQVTETITIPTTTLAPVKTPCVEGPLEEDPCVYCYCMNGTKVCSRTQCQEEMEGCKASEIPPGECCPVAYNCPDDPDIATLIDEYTTIVPVEEITPTPATVDIETEISIIDVMEVKTIDKEPPVDVLTPSPIDFTPGIDSTDLPPDMEADSHILEAPETPPIEPDTMPEVPEPETTATIPIVPEIPDTPTEPKPLTTEKTVDETRAEIDARTTGPDDTFEDITTPLSTSTESVKEPEKVPVVEVTPTLATIVEDVVPQEEKTTVATVELPKPTLAVVIEEEEVMTTPSPIEEEITTAADVVDEYPTTIQEEVSPTIATVEIDAELPSIDEEISEVSTLPEFDPLAEVIEEEAVDGTTVKPIDEVPIKELPEKTVEEVTATTPFDSITEKHLEETIPKIGIPKPSVEPDVIEETEKPEILEITPPKVVDETSAEPIVEIVETGKPELPSIETTVVPEEIIDVIDVQDIIEEKIPDISIPDIPIVALEIETTTPEDVPQPTEITIIVPDDEVTTTPDVATEPTIVDKLTTVSTKPDIEDIPEEKAPEITPIDIVVPEVPRPTGTPIVFPDDEVTSEPDVATEPAIVDVETTVSKEPDVVPTTVTIETTKSPDEPLPTDIEVSPTIATITDPDETAIEEDAPLEEADAVEPIQPTMATVPEEETIVTTTKAIIYEETTIIEEDPTPIEISLEETTITPIISETETTEVSLIEDIITESPTTAKKEVEFVTPPATTVKIEDKTPTTPSPSEMVDETTTTAFVEKELVTHPETVDFVETTLPSVDIVESPDYTTEAIEEIPETEVESNCLQNNITYQSGTSVPAIDPCESECICRNGTVICLVKSCEILPPGKLGCVTVRTASTCCARHVCPSPDTSSSCTVNELEYMNREQVPSTDPCQECFCLGGNVVCSTMVCQPPAKYFNCAPVRADPLECCPAEYTNCSLKPIEIEEPATTPVTTIDVETTKPYEIQVEIERTTPILEVVAEIATTTPIADVEVTETQPEQPSLDIDDIPEDITEEEIPTTITTDIITTDIPIEVLEIETTVPEMVTEDIPAIPIVPIVDELEADEPDVTTEAAIIDIMTTVSRVPDVVPTTVEIETTAIPDEPSPTDDEVSPTLATVIDTEETTTTTAIEEDFIPEKEDVEVKKPTIDTVEPIQPTTATVLEEDILTTASPIKEDVVTTEAVVDEETTTIEVVPEETTIKISLPTEEETVVEVETEETVKPEVPPIDKIVTDIPTTEKLEKPVATTEVPDIAAPDTTLSTVDETTIIAVVDKEIKPATEIVELIETTLPSVDEVVATEEIIEIPGEGDCSQNGIVYRSGSSVPTSDSCQESCTCVNSAVKCEIKSCPASPHPKLGCVTLRQDGNCCATFICPQTDPSSSCEVNGQVYINREFMPSTDPCQECYCIDGNPVCSTQECQLPEDYFDCAPVRTHPADCCPTKYINCSLIPTDIEEKEAVTTQTPLIQTMSTVIEEQTTTKFVSEVEKTTVESIVEETTYFDTDVIEKDEPETAVEETEPIQTIAPVIDVEMTTETEVSIKPVEIIDPEAPVAATTETPIEEKEETTVAPKPEVQPEIAPETVPTVDEPTTISILDIIATFPVLVDDITTEKTVDKKPEVPIVDTTILPIVITERVDEELATTPFDIEPAIEVDADEPALEVETEVPEIEPEIEPDTTTVSDVVEPEVDIAVQPTTAVVEPEVDIAVQPTTAVVEPVVPTTEAIHIIVEEETTTASVEEIVDVTDPPAIVDIDVTTTKPTIEFIDPEEPDEIEFDPTVIDTTTPEPVEFLEVFEDCSISGEHYQHNAHVPPPSVCQLSCICKNGTVLCDEETCPLPHSGINCTVLSNVNECCPKYDCEPTPSPKVCNIDGKSYQHGDNVPMGTHCVDCRCLEGDIKCATIDCEAPLYRYCIPSHARQDGCCKMVLCEYEEITPTTTLSPIAEKELTEPATTEKLPEEETTLLQEIEDIATIPTIEDITTMKDPTIETTATIPSEALEIDTEVHVTDPDTTTASAMVEPEVDIAVKPTVALVEPEVPTTEAIQIVIEEETTVSVEKIADVTDTTPAIVDTELTTPQPTVAIVVPEAPEVIEFDPVIVDTTTPEPEAITTLVPEPDITFDGCIILSVYYQHDEHVPPPSVCQQSCICKNGMVLCEEEMCPIPHSGINCTVVSSANNCCPKYDCEQTPSPKVCEMDGKSYQHGDIVPLGTHCVDCRCLHGDIKCATIDCEGPSYRQCVPSNARQDGCCKKILCEYNETISTTTITPEDEITIPATTEKVEIIDEVAVTPEKVITRTSTADDITTITPTTVADTTIAVADKEIDTTTKIPEELVPPEFDDMTTILITTIPSVDLPNTTTEQPFPQFPVSVPTHYFPPEEATTTWRPSTTTEFVLGPGGCVFDGRQYVSAQQIPRDDKCDFCFCFRGDIICLQQTCPPPIPNCYEEPIEGFCCPRFECPVAAVTSYKQPLQRPSEILPSNHKSPRLNNCEIGGDFYDAGQIVEKASGPCLQCVCGDQGNLKCGPLPCPPNGRTYKKR